MQRGWYVNVAHHESFRSHRTRRLHRMLHPLSPSPTPCSRSVTGLLGRPEIAEDVNGRASREEVINVEEASREEVMGASREEGVKDGPACVDSEEANPWGAAAREDAVEVEDVVAVELSTPARVYRRRLRSVDFYWIPSRERT